MNDFKENKLLNLLLLILIWFKSCMKKKIYQPKPVLISMYLEAGSEIQICIV